MKKNEERSVIREKVFQLVSQVMNVPLDSVSENSSPDTIEQWDSLLHMNLILTVEEEFDVQFTDEQIVNLMNVSSIMDTLFELL
jgi:acyl carrier protein